MHLKSGTALSRAISASFYPDLVWTRLVGGRGAASAKWAVLNERDRRRILEERTPPRAKTTFEFRGQTLRYLDHAFNLTRINERAVEVPVILSELSLRAGARVVEIGNVLSNYSSFDHQVVDKYERAPDVLNLDVVTDTLPGPSDLAVSISTLEHIGWDYPPRLPGDLLRALLNILGSLTTDGKLIGSVPLGHNAFLDHLLAGPPIPGMRLWFMKRISASNEWIECESSQANWRYVHNIRPHAMGWVPGPPFPYANSICFFDITTAAFPHLQQLLRRLAPATGP